MKFKVHVVADAEQDLFEIYHYISASGSPLNAEKLLNKFEQQAIISLEHMPERGHTPPELRRIGVYGYREIHLKVYRIIYEIIGYEVFVHCVLDGRRDLQDLLRQKKNIEGFRQVFEQLQTIKPVETTTRIFIEDVFDEYENEYYTSVSGKDGTLNKESNPEIFKDDEIGNQEVSYGIEFIDWAEWLDMDIDPESLSKYSELDIIVHCLWEMTFYGYTQEDIKETIDTIHQKS